jgi:hypothetical protein
MASPTAGAVNAFFRSRQDALTASNDAALQDVGRLAKNMANQQLKTRFKRRAGRAGTRFLKSSNGKPATVYVNVNPGFLRVFEEGVTIKGDLFLVVPIAPFKRVGKKGLDINALKRQFKLKSIPTKGGGYLITLNGKPAYNLIKQAELTPRTNIREEAANIAATHADIVDGLLNAKI